MTFRRCLQSASSLPAARDRIDRTECETTPIECVCQSQSDSEEPGDLRPEPHPAVHGVFWSNFRVSRRVNLVNAVMQFKRLLDITKRG